MKTYFLKDSRTGGEATYATKLTIGFVEEEIVASFDCSHSCCYSAGENFNDKLYEGDVVELFIYAGVDGHYFEFEVSPNNAHFLADIANDGKSFHGTLIQEDFFQSSVSKKEGGYCVEIHIPLEKLGCKKSEIRVNAFRIETHNGIPDACLFALNPTLGPSFHVRDKLLTYLD